MYLFIFLVSRLSVCLFNVFIGWICISLKYFVKCYVLLWLRVILPDVKEKSLSDVKLTIKRTGSPPSPVLDLERFVIVFKCELILCLPFMTFFLRIHFFPRSLLLWVIVICRADCPIGQLKHLRMYIWSKFTILTRRMKPERWWRVIIQRRTWVQSTSCGRKGTSSLYCLHLIGSGIKHFVTVQAKQRGRNIGWMLLCPLCREPLH